MNNTSGKITKEADGFKVQFERTFNHPIEKVWEAITDPEKLKWWFTDIEMDMRPGGKLTIWFRTEERMATYGEIISIEPPYRFVWSWEGELAVWELTETGKDQCKLTLSYSKLAPEYAIGAPAGFHELLGRLEDMLNGSRVLHAFGTEENDPKHQKIKKQYEKALLAEYPELDKYQPVVIEHVMDASPERIWKALTDKEQMRQWYFDPDEFRPEVGFVFRFNGQGVKGAEYVHVCEVQEVIPLKKLTYTWSYEGYEGMSYVIFELVPEGNKTRVILTHKGLHTFPENPDFAKRNFRMGWAELIGKLLREYVQ